MKSSPRVALLRSRWNRKTRSLAAVLAVANMVHAKSVTDERDTARRASSLTAERLPAMDDSIVDSDNVEIAVSRLSVHEEGDEGRSLASYLLSPAERKMLSHEWRRNVAPAPVPAIDPDALPEGYVNEAFEPFVPAFAGLAEPNAFELAMADLPLQLMPAPVILALTA